MHSKLSLCHSHTEGWSGWGLTEVLWGNSIHRNVFWVHCSVIWNLAAYFCHYISCREHETPRQALWVLDDILLFSVFSQNCKNLTSWLVWSPNIAHELKSSLNLTCDVIVIMFYSWPQSVLLKERYKGFWINLIFVMGMCSKTSQRWWVANDFSFAIFLS